MELAFYDTMNEILSKMKNIEVRLKINNQVLLCVSRNSDDHILDKKTIDYVLKLSHIVKLVMADQLKITNEIIKVCDLAKSYKEGLKDGEEPNFDIRDFDESCGMSSYYTTCIKNLADSITERIHKYFSTNK